MTIAFTILLTDLKKFAEYPTTQKEDQDIIEGTEAWNECDHDNQLVRPMVKCRL